MYLEKRHLTRKARIFLAAGNLCLFSGLMLTILGKDLGLHHAALYHGLRGFLIGLAIALIFWAFRLSGDCSANQS